jgi:hypothetical protein
MSIADKSLSEIQELLPARHCMICHKTIGEIGGRRMIAQGFRGIAVSDQVLTKGYKNLQKCVRLIEGRELYLVAWGEKSIITDAVIEQATADYRKGFRPWFCQVCGQRLCHLCGELLPRPVASDYIFDDGGSVHCPILGADPGCWNPECEKFRGNSKPYPGWSRAVPI